MTAQQIVEQLLTEFKTDQAGLAKMLGVHKSTISNIQNKHTQNISANLARKVLRLRPEINYDFLMGKTNQIHNVFKEKIGTSLKPTLNCLGKEKLTISEITQFMIKHIAEFEKEPAFEIYKKTIENDIRIKLLEDRIMSLNSEKTSTK